MKIQKVMMLLIMSMSIPTFASVKLIQVVGVSPNSSLLQCPALESALNIAEMNRNKPGFANEAKGILELFEYMEGATAQLIFQIENETYPIQLIRKNAGPYEMPAFSSIRIPGATEGTVMNGTYSAQVVLTLAGSCPFYDRQKRSLRTPISTPEWEKYFTVK